MVALTSYFWPHDVSTANPLIVIMKAYHALQKKLNNNK